MKRIILILVVVLLLKTISAQDKIGYLVAVEYANGVSKIFKTESEERVNTSVKMKIGQDIDVIKILKGKTVFVEYRTNTIHIYVEKKKVVTKNGKKKYKTIKK